MQLVAMMEDRYLVNYGKEQIYGTQLYGSEVTDSISGEKQWIYIIWAIENPETVNERRKSIGFDTTIEEYAARLDIEYKIFTLDQAKEMFGK